MCIVRWLCVILNPGTSRSKAAIPSYLEIVDFIASGTAPQAVVDYCPSPEAQNRVAELIQREKGLVGASGFEPRPKPFIKRLLHLDGGSTPRNYRAVAVRRS